MNNTMPRRPALRAAAFVLCALAPAAATAVNINVHLHNAEMTAGIDLAPGDCVALAGVGSSCSQAANDPLPGWVVVGEAAGVYNPGDGAFAAPWNGGEVGFVGGTRKDVGRLRQFVGIMRDHRHYRFGVDVACRLDKPCPGFLIQAWFDDQPLHQYQGSPQAMTPGVFQHVTLGFDSMPGKHLTIVLTSPGRGDRSEVVFDNPRLTVSPTR